MKSGALALSFLACLLIPSAAFSQVLNPAAPRSIEQSPAYQNYLKRPKCELSKLLYLVDRIRSSGEYRVIYKNREYEPGKLIPIVRLYVSKSYKNEKAESWIETHAYRTRDGRLIYVKEPGGRVRVLKDLLLEELSRLQ